MKHYQNLPVWELRNDIKEAFQQHWTFLDEGHREPHFTEVESTALFIAQRCELKVNPHHVVMVAYFHDLFTWTRPGHHELAHQFIMTSDHPCVEWLGSCRKQVALACREHRATFKGEFSSRFSELMNAADRGFPENVERLLERAIHFRTAQGMTREEARPQAIVHMKEKFGTNGYARYPRLYIEAFGEELKKFRQEIDSM